MSKYINFEDSIFILLMRMRVIQDSLLLDAEPDLFLKKTVDDICFIDTTLETLLRRLSENPHLIEMNEISKSLAEMEERFSQVIFKFLSVRNSGPEFVHAAAQVLALKSRSQERSRLLEDMAHGGDAQDETAVISSAEIYELLGNLQAAS